MTLLQKVLDIRSTTDPETSIASISEGVSIRGFNMWLLFCSAALASIGLDTNSTAVIIGAMLISPLMSPILGVGLSLAIRDKQLLIRSTRNLAMAVVLSLIASVLYFYISPFANPTAELKARIYPTLLDVLVALFGGVAGIISASRKGHSNALPGVAIATALMPPLCTAGYGIATRQWHFFGGAFYLFFINAVFISLATFIIVKYLKFPQKVYATGNQQSYSSVLFSAVIVIVTLPSIYFLYTVYVRETAKKEINDIVINSIQQQGNEILKWDLQKQDTVTLIKVYYSGKALSDSFKNAMTGQLVRDGVEGYELYAQRVNLTKDEINQVSEGVIRNMFQQMGTAKADKGDSRFDLHDSLYKRLQQEVRIAFPAVDTLTNGLIIIPGQQGNTDTLPVVLYRLGARADTKEVDRLYQYLTTRLAVDTLVLINRLEF